MLTSQQLRAARTMLRLSVAELAKASGIGVATIKRIEAGDGVPPVHARTMAAIHQALLEQGIEFIGTPDDGPGVRLRRPKNI